MWSTKHFEEMNDDELCVQRAYGVIRERANYYRLGHTEGDIARAIAYESASEILKAAMDRDWEVFDQYDYFDETEEWACTPDSVAKVCEVE